MLCRSPFRRNGAEFGCGQCMACRVNKRRLWTARIMLESTQHVQSSFLTLTYAPEHLPPGGNLVPRDLKKYLMRVRTALNRPFRYFAVGEYGEKSTRPHYHACVFGLFRERELVELWPHGFVHVGQLTDKSAHYCAGYVTKKMTNKADPRLKGRPPEFARMSLKPGIGAPAIDAFADWVNSSLGADEYTRNLDVPKVFRWDNKMWPFGRYLVEVLRERAGYDRKAQAAYVELEKLRRHLACPSIEAYLERELKRESVSAALAGKMKVLDQRRFV